MDYPSPTTGCVELLHQSQGDSTPGVDVMCAAAAATGVESGRFKAHQE